MSQHIHPTPLRFVPSQPHHKHVSQENFDTSLKWEARGIEDIPEIFLSKWNSGLNCKGLNIN